MEENQNGVNNGENTGSQSPADQQTTGTETANAGAVSENGGKGTEEKMIPYSRFKEKVDELNTIKAENSSRELSQSERAEKGGTTTPAEGDKPKDEATSKEETKSGENFVTKAELEERDHIKARVDEAKTMGTTYDGSNGLPTFDIDNVTKFMKERKFYGSYEEAYKLLHHDSIVAKAVQDAIDGNTGQTTTKGNGAFDKSPKKDAVSREGIAKMSLDEFAKMGGSKALKGAMISGTLE